MPANPKYLNPNPWQRFAKISAAILGGYLLSMLLHLVLAVWLDPVTVLITCTYSSFLLWTLLMVIAFLSRNGWKLWGYFLLSGGILGVLLYLGKNVAPFIT